MAPRGDSVMLTMVLVMLSEGRLVVPKTVSANLVSFLNQPFALSAKTLRGGLVMWLLLDQGGGIRAREVEMWGKKATRTGWAVGLLEVDVQARNSTCHLNPE
jgi:hypothetical protein